MSVAVVVLLGVVVAAGLWELERELRPTAARLLARAAG